MIIGTAGHIDHGKSALVEALTGRRMDRLAEERSRGITIDLNFAPLPLAEGRTAGVVDVPGHEDFVRTMVAGAAGMDLVLLVVAADDGVMPQTREHLAIVEALGVARGIPVLTKCDLVDREWQAMVREEFTRWLATSTVSWAPVHTVSALTGAGLEELRATLNAECALAPGRDGGASFRMPVDRAFSMAGAGTVVTGSVWSGTLSIGEHVRVLPSARLARVRTIEVHGSRNETARGGHRAALGLAGLDRHDVRRGDVVVDAQLPWEATLALDAEVHLLPDAPRPLTTRTRVRLLLGTAEVIARMLPREAILPGRSGLARLTCESPVVAAGNDRFVLRSYSPVSTIGGGVVLDPLPPRRRAAWPQALSAPDLGERLRGLLGRHPPGMATGALALRAGVPPTTVERLLRSDAAARELPGGWVLESDVREAAARGVELVVAYHEGKPSSPGMPIETLRRGAHRSPLVAEAAVARLVASGELEAASGVARRPGFTAQLSGGAAALEEVVDLVCAAGLAAPEISELARRLDRSDVPDALRLAARGGKIEAVTRDWYVGKEALERFRSVLVESADGGEVLLAALRARTGLARKQLIPLLEWADRKGITRRDGDIRRLT